MLIINTPPIEYLCTFALNIKIIKTRIVMKNKQVLHGITIREDSNGFLSLTDLSEAYTHARVKDGLAQKNMTDIITNLSFRSWLENEYKITTKGPLGAKFLKSVNLYKTTGARTTKSVWVEEKIWNYVKERLFSKRNSSPSFSFENRYIELLNTLFLGVLPFCAQYKVLNYRVDVYFESLNLCIEFDEPHHAEKIEEDKEREEKIKKHLGCEFLRLKIGEELISIREIMLRWKAENIATLTNAIIK